MCDNPQVHRFLPSFPTNLAFVETLLYSERDIRGDFVSESGDILSVDGLHSQIGLYHRRVERKQGLCYLFDSRVLGSKSGNEDGVCAIRVEFEMGCSLRKHGHLILVKVVDANGPDTILGDEHGCQSPFDDDVDFRAARMDMRCIESAGANEADGHGHARSN